MEQRGCWWHVKSRYAITEFAWLIFWLVSSWKRYTFVMQVARVRTCVIRCASGSYVRKKMNPNTKTTHPYEARILYHMSFCFTFLYVCILSTLNASNACSNDLKLGFESCVSLYNLDERSNISDTLGFSVPTNIFHRTILIQNLMPKASNFKFQGGWIVSGFWDAQTSTPTPTAPPPRDYGKRYFTADGFHQTVGSRMRRTNSIFYALG